ncbi:hypothetical protein PWW31_15515 [Vibrio harveyi]|nr:hypothetical protein PWW31_15515 [Vibrio harveyi]
MLVFSTLFGGQVQSTTDTKERQVWKGRAAMIDAIFYEGSE